MSKTNDSSILNIFGIISGAILITFWGAFVFIKLWNWFAVPFLITFIPNLPIMTYPLAIGLQTFISVCNLKTPSSHDDKSFGQILVFAFIAYSSSLFVGWLVKMFM